MNATFAGHKTTNMANNWLERTELLLGQESVKKLSNKHVLVIGLGGVGAYAAEQICRAGVGKLTIADGDIIQPSNINRQLPALHSTIGKPKAETLGKRLKDINPNVELTIIQEYLRDERLTQLLSNNFDYVVDAIDTLSPKVFLIHDAIKFGHKVVSSMGSGGKLDPTQVKISDISESYGCPLARILRKRLHRLGIREGFKVVYSAEKVPEHAMKPCEGEPNKKTTIGTISYMPPLFGCMIASVVIRDLLA